MTERPEVTLLVDAPSLIYRALFSSPDTIVGNDGVPMNAAHGFLRMLAGLIATHRPAYLACADDADWRPEWRVELIDSYKSIRAEVDSAQAQAEVKLEPQLPVIAQMLELCGIPLIGCPGYEAEDVIGSLARRAPGPVAIFSGDRDLFQLVRDPDVTVVYPIRGVTEVQIVDEGYIATKYGIPGGAYLDYAVLRGDPSDGLPGVRGIGDKLAAGLITRYGDLDGVLAAAAEHEGGGPLAKVKRDIDYVRRALSVVTIATELPLPDHDLRTPSPPDPVTVMAEAERWGLSSPARALIASLKQPARGR